MNELKECRPGQAYSILKKMGAQPGDCTDSSTFTLPAHESENLSDEQSAERIGQYFAQISQEFPPLDVKLLPPRVQCKLENESAPPTIDNYDVYKKIRSAKKPRSGVPNDLPKLLVQEFAPELAKPVGRIINRISSTGSWPEQWNLNMLFLLVRYPCRSLKMTYAPYL